MLLVKVKDYKILKMSLHYAFLKMSRGKYCIITIPLKILYFLPRKAKGGLATRSTWTCKIEIKRNGSLLIKLFLFIYKEILTDLKNWYASIFFQTTSSLVYRLIHHSLRFQTFAKISSMSRYLTLKYWERTAVLVSLFYAGLVSV